MKILLTGDLHGRYKYYRKFLKHVRELDDEVGTVISLGDFGYDYDRNFRKYMEMALVDYGFNCLFLRGNHDDVGYLNRVAANPPGAKVSPHMTYLPDGTVFDLGGLKFGVLGGATSSDRMWRVKGESWWEGEDVQQEAAKKLSGHKLDVLLTHDIPEGGGPEGFERNFGDPGLAHEARLGREIILATVEDTRPEYLFHGHLHRNYTRNFRTPRGHHVKMMGLDCDQSNYSAFGYMFETGYYL